MRKYEFFRFEKSKSVRRPLTIFGLPNQYSNITSQENYGKLDEATIAYFKGKLKEEVSAVLTTPAFLINDEMKRLLINYSPSLPVKAVQLFAGEEDCQDNYLYWLPFFQPVQCLHSSTSFYPNGQMRALIIDRALLPPVPFFRVEGILEYQIIVNLPVAESILRRYPYGISLTPVEVV